MSSSQITDVSEIAHLIQLAVAPVFLLSGIGAMLAVMTNRLGRVIDRARLLETRLEHADEQRARAIHRELYTLGRRARLVSHAITLCTATALLICTVIAVLFASAFLPFDVTLPVGFLFIAAMLAFFLGLLNFLREIFMATANMQIGPDDVKWGGWGGPDGSALG